jgi:hypothetical protein
LEQERAAALRAAAFQNRMAGGFEEGLGFPF